MEKFTKTIKSIICAIAIASCSSLYAQPNLVANYDMENGSNSPANWSSEISSGTMTCSWDTLKSVSGSHSLKIEVSTDGRGQWAQLLSTAISDSVTYRFRVHIYSTNVNSGAGEAELHWFDSNDTYLGRTLLAPTVANQWQELKNNNVTPPQSAVKVYILLRAYKTGVYYLDDPVLTRKDNNLHTLSGKFPIGLYNMPNAELLDNGDAEERTYTDTQIPRTWYNGYNYPVYSWDSNLAYSGYRSLQISLSSDIMADWRQVISNISDTDTFHLKAMIYATNAASGSHSIELQWFDSSSNYLGRDTYSATTTGDWVTIDEDGIIPPSRATKIYFLLRAYKTGTYNFDTISLTFDQTDAEKVQALADSGFNLLMTSTLLDTMNSVSGFYGAVNVNSTSTYLPTLVNLLESKSALRIWHNSPDEPAWWTPPISSSVMATGYDTILSNDDYYSSCPHRVWLNHAPRGTQASPSDFSLLRPYSAGADIISMDIYPIGSVGHSNLENKTISCVGEYTKILYDYACTDSSGLQDKPIWMVLQGAGQSDLADSRVTHGAELHWLDSSGTVKRIDRFYVNTTGSWQTINGQGLVPPEGAITISVQLRGYAPGTYYFDNVSLLENGVNILLNSNFETEDGSSGYPASWTRSMPTGTTATWDSSVYVSASHSAKTTVTVSSITSWYQNVNIDPGKTYNFSACIRSSLAGQYARPTWTQSRFMAYDAIINGARGIVYWGCNKIPCNSDFWYTLKDVIVEVSGLSDVLTSPESFRECTSSSADIELLLLDSPDGLYLIAANKSSQTVYSATIWISGLPLSQITEYNFSTPETISNNSFSKSFQPYEVKIWNIE